MRNYILRQAVLSLYVLLAFCPVLAAQNLSLKSDQNLARRINGKFRDVKAKEVVEFLRQKAGLNLTLDSTVIQDRPVLMGETLVHNMPALGLMNTLAKSKYIQGAWQKSGDGYKLVATYTGLPPPLPKPIPREVLAKMGYKVPPEALEKEEPSGSGRTWLIVIGTVSFVGFCFCLWLRSRQKKNVRSESTPAAV